MTSLINLHGMTAVDIISFQPVIPLDGDSSSHATSQPFPTNALPSYLKHAVEEVVDFVQCPVSLAVGSALGALSLAISPHVHMCRSNGLVGPTNLYILMLGESGERKSSVDGYFLSPAQTFQKEFNQNNESLLKQYQADSKAYKARVKGIERGLASAEKDNKTDAIIQLTDQLKVLEQTRPVEPAIMQLFYQNFTIEGLLKNLTRWPYGIINSPEAGTVLGGYSTRKECQLNFFANLNMLWDKAILPVNRATSDSYTIEDVCVTLCLMTQPASLHAFQSATSDLSRGTGFYARCLLSHPESTIGDRPFKPAPHNWPALGKYNQRLKTYLSKLPSMNDSHQLKPGVMTFQPEAEAC